MSSLLLGVHYLDEPLPPRKYVEQPDVPFWKVFFDGEGLFYRAIVVACSVMMARSCTLWVLSIHSFSMVVFVCRLSSSFNARKFGELAIKTVVMDGKGVSVQKPRICL